MKRPILAIILLGVITVAAAAAPLAQNEAFVLLNGLALWQDDKAKLTWMENLAIGDRVTLLNRTSKFKQDGQERDFVRIKAPDGKEGWVRQPFLASRASLAIVKADQAAIYSEPREVKLTSKYVSSMTLVAVLQDGSTGSFAKIQGYDRAQKMLFTDATFVSVDDLTMSDMDINAVILYSVAMDDPKVKNNLLKLAITKYGGTIFLANLQTAAGMTPAAAKETRPLTGSYLVNDDNVNVRSLPDEKSGQVVGKLNSGAQVDVTEMTAQTYTVGDNSAPWYHIKNPDGWVFGSFLEPAQ